MSHHISNNFTSASTNNQADLTAAKADIVAIKAKTDFLSITQNVNLDVVETDTLNNKLDVAAIKTKTDLISVNSNDIYLGDKNFGINTTNPNCRIELGDSTDVERIRLNGPNNVAISSEILFTDILTNNNPEYFQGCGIRYNSDNNSLQFITDNDDDGTAEIAMTILRANGFVGVATTTPSYPLSVNGIINTSSEYHHREYGIPMIIGKTSLNSATVAYHKLGHGTGAGNSSGSHTDNTFYMPDSNFKVVFKPPSTKVWIDIEFYLDRYFAGRNLYWALGTSSSASSIIGKTLSVSESPNSDWSSRKVQHRIHLDGLSAGTLYVRYIFVKQIVINSDNSIGSNSAASYILWGGYDSHSNGASGQSKGHYQLDSTPDLPNDNDNFGALEATVWSIPSTHTTSASTSNPFQCIGY